MGEQTKVQEYRGRAAILRQLARDTLSQETRELLLLLAGSFERLADEVVRLTGRERERLRLASAD